MNAPQRHQQFVFFVESREHVDAAAAERLVRARKMAGYVTPGNAVSYFRWKSPDYFEHEAGARNITADDALRYASGYRVSARWILMGA
ncbi:MAG: hypothetical protein EKK29_10215 [Hyphomicrobiales bacterium]|nr:MAG: hypothetical protein EKK29_10215 [Hyphomicrobiales bacterium]